MWSPPDPAPAVRLRQPPKFLGYGKHQISIVGDLHNEALEMEDIIREAFESANATFYTRAQLPDLENHIRAVGHILQN